MKSFFLSLFVVVTLMFTTYNNSKSVCPTGYNSVTLSYWVNGCQYEVDICYTCPYSGGDNWIRFDSDGSIRKVTTGCSPSPALTSGELIYKIFQNLGTPQEFELLCKLKPCDYSPPIQPKKTRIVQPNCWVAQKVQLPNNQIQIVYIPCDNAECITIYERCIDYSTNPASIYSYTTYSQNDTPDCNFIEYDPLSTIGPGQTSICFRVNTNCD